VDLPDSSNFLISFTHQIGERKYTTPNHNVKFVYLSGDRLYTSVNNTLYVYSVSDFTSPIATYLVDFGWFGDYSYCFSAMIIDDCLYLGGDKKLNIFEVTPSLTKPLKPVNQIPT
jgi:hypothetical protein